MNTNGDLRHYIKNVEHELNNPTGRHLNDEEVMLLIQDGDLPEADRVALRTHLVQCGQCIVTFREMRDFLGSDISNEPEIDEIAKERVWRAVRPEIPTAAPVQPSVTRRRPMFVYAIAACLAIMFTITGILAINLWQQKQALLSQLQNEQKRNADNAEQIKNLEADRQVPQPGPTEPNPDLERQVAKLKEPSVNTPIFDVFPADSIERGSGGGSNTTTVPATAKNFVLLLNAAGTPQYPNYQVEILDSSSKAVWTGTGLKRDNTGNFSLSMTKEFLPRGTYRLRVYGIAGPKRQKVADYAVCIN